VLGCACIGDMLLHMPRLLKLTDLSIEDSGVSLTVVDAFVSDGKTTGTAGDDDRESEGSTPRIYFV